RAGGVRNPGLENHRDRDHSVHQAVHRGKLADEGPRQARRYEPPTMSRMKRAWKIPNPKPNPKTNSVVMSSAARQQQEAADDCAGQNPDAVPRDTVHRGAECLPPLRSDVSFVRPGQRLAAARYIEHRADRTSEEPHQYEAPFQDR